MSKWIENLKNWQQVVIALFFGILGVALWVLPFYLSGKEMVKPTGAEIKFTEVHWLFLLFGTIAIAISLRLSRIDKLFSIGTGFLSKFSNSKKGGNDGT